MEIRLINNKGEFTVSLEDFINSFGNFVQPTEGPTTAHKYETRLLDFLQSYGE